MKTKNKFNISNVPIEEFNALLDRVGLNKAWYSILATHLSKLNRNDLNYIFSEKEFDDIETQKNNYIDGLTVGEISVLYEYSLAYQNRDSRKNEGQYFTPDDIAQVMAERAVKFPKNKIWVDPCSGVGNLSFWLTHSHDDPEHFIKNKLYLVDKDALALFIARFIFTIHFQKNDSRLFTTIMNRFICDDFLFSTNLPKYNYAILNPPYLLVSADTRFKTSAARDLYTYFLERVIDTTTGFVSITPQTFTNGQKFQTFRKLLLGKFNLIDVYCFDNVPDNIFKGIKFGSKNSNKANSTRAGIIVAKQNNAEKKFRITPLLRWRTQERQTLLHSLDNFLSEISPTEYMFPKLQDDLLPLYNFAKKQKRIMAHLTSRRPTPYMLMVPSTPRYFISALKCKVERSSFRTLYFYSKSEMDTAYLLLNSSYMYWWWRVNDGGMTISEKTILTLPIIDELFINQKLINKIEQSEKNNKVFKLNAGKNNENVKHPRILIDEINANLFPRFASFLGTLHNNSVI